MTEGGFMCLSYTLRSIAHTSVRTHARTRAYMREGLRRASGAETLKLLEKQNWA